MPLTNTDLAEEIEAINAIYDPDTITVSSTATAPSTLDLGSTSSSEPTQTTLKLQIPSHPHLSFLLGFPATYPDTPPLIQGTASTAARGEGKLAVDILASILSRVYTAGSVCLFDLISEAETVFTEIGVGGESTTTTSITTTTTTTATTSTDDPSNSNSNDNWLSAAHAHERPSPTELTTTTPAMQLHETFGLPAPPEWMLSEVITEKKSVFVGRAARVTSLGQARAFLDYLLASEKKVAAATHNISAWRIRERKNSGMAGGDSTVAGDVSIVQDCDDDGETAAGGRLLHLMQLMDVWDVVVVVTRWYGGVLLGPDRFRIINAAGRDALVKGGFVRESSGGNGEGGKKKKGKK